MSDDPFDPFDDEKPGDDAAPGAEFDEAEEGGTYALGQPAPPVEPPRLVPPVISRDDEDEEEPDSAEERRERLRILNEDPLVGETLVSALWYPLAGQGFRVLGLYTVLFLIWPLIPFFIIRFMLTLFTMAYAGLMLLETAAFTLDGVKSGPRLPSLDLEDFQAGLCSMGAVLIGFAPTVIVLMLAEEGFPLLIALPLLVFCPFVAMYYIPMGLIAIAEIEDVAALNPLVVLRAIWKMKAVYFGLVTLAAAMVAVPVAGLVLLGAHLLVIVPIGSFLLVYSLIVLMRAAAMMYVDQNVRVDELVEKQAPPE